MKPMMVGAAWVMVSVLVHAVCTAQAPKGDVPYVPTPEHVVTRMLEMAQVGENDIVYDLGSGDGRIAIAAVRDFNARRAFGVDIDPELVRESNENARRAGVADRVEFREQDLFQTDLSRPTVITLYLLPSVNLRLMPSLLALKPGTRVVSHAFDMGDWKSDAHTVVHDGGYYEIFLWIIPARVAGVWEWRLATPEGEKNVELQLRQRFQELSGTAKVGDEDYELVRAELRGDRISLVLQPKGQPGQPSLNFHGKVQDDQIIGHVGAEVDQPPNAPVWRARRTERAEPDFEDRSGLNRP